jgi:hypothetical protein
MSPSIAFPVAWFSLTLSGDEPWRAVYGFFWHKFRCNFRFELSKLTEPAIHERVVSSLCSVSGELANQVV